MISQAFGYNRLSWFNVADYASIQAALTAAGNAGGGYVFLPAGTYTISATLLMPSFVTLVGAGRTVTIIKLAAGLNIPILKTLNFDSLTLSGSIVAGEHSFRITDLTFDGNSANQTTFAAQAGVCIYGYDFDLERVTIRNVKGENALYTEWGVLGTPSPDFAMESRYVRMRIHDNSLNGNGAAWRNRGPHDSFMSDTHIYRNTTNSPGIWTETCITSSIAAGSNGVDVSTFAGAGTLNVANTLGMPAAGSLNVVTGSGTKVITYTAKTATTYTGCNSSGATGVMSTGGSVTSTGPYSAVELLLVNCHVWGNHSYAILCDSSTQMVQCQLEGATLGALWARTNFNWVGGKLFFLGSGFGLQLGDANNKPTASMVRGMYIYQPTGGSSAAAALNIIQSSSGVYDIQIHPATGNTAQQVFGTFGNNESKRIRYGGTNTPTLAALAANGTTPPTPTNNHSTDFRGGVNIGSGTAPSAGNQVSVTYFQPQPEANCLPVISPGNAATAALLPYVNGPTATGFNISFQLAPAASQAVGTYVVFFHTSLE